MNSTLALCLGVVLGGFLGLGGACLAMNSKESPRKKAPFSLELDLESGNVSDGTPRHRPTPSPVGNWRIQMAMDRDQKEIDKRWKARSAKSSPKPCSPAPLPKATTSVKQNNTEIKQHKTRLQTTLAKLQEIAEKQKAARLSTQRSSVRKKTSNSDDETLRRRRSSPRRDVTPDNLSD